MFYLAHLCDILAFLSTILEHMFAILILIYNSFLAFLCYLYLSVHFYRAQIKYVHFLSAHLY